MADRNSTGQPPAFFLSKPVPAVLRGNLVHVGGRVAVADFRPAVCAESVLLGLELLSKFAIDEQQEARQRKNAQKAAAMPAMLEHIADLRVKLAAGAS